MKKLGTWSILCRPTLPNGPKKTNSVLEVASFLSTPRRARDSRRASIDFILRFASEKESPQLQMDEAPADAAQTQRLRTTLESFYNRIRHAAHMPIGIRELSSRGDSNGAILWLEMRLRAEVPTFRHRVDRSPSLAALHLLALLAQVDWKLWTQVVEEIWPELSTRSGVSIQDLAPVVVGIDVKMRQYQDLEDVDPISTARSSLKELDVLVSALPVARKASVEIPVRVSLQYEWNRLSKIVEFLTTQQGIDERDTNNSRYKGLRIQSIKFELGGFVLGRPPVRLLMKAMALGLHVVDFGLIYWDVFHDDPKLYVKAAHTLFAIDCQDSSARLRGVEDFGHLRDMRNTMVPSVYSAVSASPTVRCVAVDFGSATMPKRIRSLALSWFAYAVFRREAVSAVSIQKLVLRVDELTQEDLDTMDTIMEARDPLHELLDRPASLRGGTISAKRFSLFDPIANGRVLVRGDYESTHELKHLPVVERRKEWRTVLLPGWGRARVHNRDVLQQNKASTRSATPLPAVPTFPEMVLSSVNAGSADSVLHLLERIGNGLQRLTIQDINDPEDVLPDAWLRRLFEVCPRLESLVLRRACISSLQVFVDGYVSGGCRLKRLSLIETEVLNRDSDFEAFIAALGDRQQPITSRLEEFVWYRLDDTTFGIPDIAIKLASMLERNGHLRILDVKVLCSYFPRKDQLRRSVEPVLAFNGQRLGYRKTPSDTTRRVSFLSVVSPRHEVHKPSYLAVERLDASVLANIFQFAASDLRRCVAVGFNFTGSSL